MVMEADGPAPLMLEEEKRKFDTPGEFSAQLACPPIAACVDDGTTGRDDDVLGA